MKYEIKPSSKFKKGLKAAAKRGRDLNKLTEVIQKLADGETLPPENKDHPLVGNLIGKRECHIEPDWLLIYEYENADLILYLLATGSHSDLFHL